MNIESKAELIMAIEDYECEEKQRWNKGIDFTALDTKSDDKTLLRLIIEPKSKSGIVGINAVRRMDETMKHKNYDKGFLISERFSEAAREEMRRKDIQMVSKKFMPSFKPQKLYLRIQDYVDDLCKAKCGKVPKKESDCKGYSESAYFCKVRVINDNASFHFKQGWANLLENDLMQLLKINNSKKKQGNGARMRRKKR